MNHWPGEPLKRLFLCHFVWFGASYDSGEPVPRESLEPVFRRVSWSHVVVLLPLFAMLHDD